MNHRFELRISKGGLEQDAFGSHIVIKRVGIYRDGKWVKWVKLTQLVYDALVRNTRELTEETAQKIINGNV